MVIVENLVKQYGAKTAVKGIDFRVQRGEIFGLLGPNGAGKTSTIAILACLHRPTSGAVRISGLDREREESRVKQRVGVVPQELALYTTLTAQDNLEFFGNIYGLRGALLRQRIGEVLEVVGLRDCSRQVVETFSGGMKRRLNLACGLLHRPELLLLDEPTVGVDPQSRNLIFENIRRLNQELGMTVIYTTHYMEEAEALCHRVAVMDQGRIIADDTPAELISRHGDGLIEIRAQGVTPKLREQMAGVAFVREVAEQEGLVRIQSARTGRSVVDILGLMKEHGLELEALHIREASLENVFLKLTGKTLRDSEIPDPAGEGKRNV